MRDPRTSNDDGAPASRRRSAGVSPALATAGQRPAGRRQDAGAPLSRAAFALICALSLAACSKKAEQGTGGQGHGGGTGGEAGSVGCPDVPTEIFAAKCASAKCHGATDPEQGLDLVSPGLAERVVGQPGSGCTGILANPDYPSKSLLYDKLLESPDCGARMPTGKGAVPLTDNEIACVKAWIAAQAMGTGGTGGMGGAGSGTGGFGGFGGEGGMGGAGTCTDMIKNGVETDVDCGGLCPLCPVGKGCAGPTDCETLACANDVCVDASCADKLQNGTETDIDCGGPDCPACAGGLHCFLPTDCASMDCQPSGICASSCTNGVTDGLEKGIDCGGVCPIGCPPGTPCGNDGDCASDICDSGTCATPTCSDVVKNGGESDVDCGGPCAGCLKGEACNTAADCAEGGCVGGKCADILLISEVRTSGKDGNKFSDEFVEIYNPGNMPVTFDSTWQVRHRSAQGGCQDAGFGLAVFVGGNQVIPAHGHLLIKGTAYAQMPAGDATFVNSPQFGSIADAGSVSIVRSGQLVDTVCFHYDAATLNSLMTCALPYKCSGMPVSNLPHNGSGQGASAADASIERKPGGAAGAGQVSGDSATDFKPSAPANPQNLASAPAP